MDPSDDIILIASDGIIIRMAASEIRLCHRPSKGVIIMRLEEGARIVSLARAPQEEDEENGETPELIRCQDQEPEEIGQEEPDETEQPEEDEG